MDFNLDDQDRRRGQPGRQGGPGRPDRPACSTRGPRPASALEIADQVAALGATLSTGGTWDASNVGLSTLSKNLDPALAIFADVVQHPAFDDKEFKRVRDNTLTAITRRKDSPPTVASLALSHLLYGQKHPYGWPMSGTEASIKKVTPADLRAFYDANYHPNNAALIVAGDTTEAALRGKLEAAFKGWRSKHVAAKKPPAPAGAAAETKIFLIDKAGAPQSSIRVGLVGIERQSPDYFPVTVMNLILGGGFYRLDLNLREGKGWTYGARSSFDSRKTPGPVLGRRRVRRPPQRGFGRRDPQGAERHPRRRRDRRRAGARQGPDQQVVPRALRHPRQRRRAARRAGGLRLPRQLPRPTTRARSPRSARTTSAGWRASTSTRPT